jgi:hypothetical protein
MTCGETGPKVDPAIDALAKEAVSNFGEVTHSIARGTPRATSTSCRFLRQPFFAAQLSEVLPVEQAGFPDPAWTCEVLPGEREVFRRLDARRGSGGMILPPLRIF